MNPRTIQSENRGGAQSSVDRSARLVFQSTLVGALLKMVKECSECSRSTWTSDAGTLAARSGQRPAGGA